MTAGETLLKVADYPFAYSFVILLGGTFGFGLTENKILLLGIAGAFGTFLTIVDPGGIFVKNQLKNRLKNRDVKSLFPEIKYFHKAIDTRAIGIENDRIIGMIYFAISIILFIIAIWSPYSFVDNFHIKDKNGQVILGSLPIQIISTILSFVIVYILGKIGKTKWNELDKKLEVAAMHQFSIGNEYATKTTVENMTRAVDLGDWASAEEWAQELKEEIENKKGKREIIIKSAEFVYRLLHEDSIAISESCLSILNSKQYYGITANMWTQIKRSGTHLMIEDKDLRKKIDEFYNLISSFGNISGRLNRTTEILIREQMTKVFLKNVRNIRYFIQHLGTYSDPNLVGCALFKIHPLESRQNETVSAKQLDIEFQNEPTITVTSKGDFDRFDSAWQAVLSELEKNPEVPLVKEMLDKIITENQNLISIYEEHIALQWKA